MKLRYIDALRGIAIFGVLMVHCGQYGMNQHLPLLVQTVILHGAHGVQLFYIVSAFTLFLTLEKRDLSDKSIWFGFYTRRFFRIAPMYYLGICYYLWQDGLGPRYWLADANGISAMNILSNIFFFHGFNPYWITSVVPGGWSIAVEMLFYCLIPFLFIRIRNTQQAMVFFLLALGLRASLQFALGRNPLIESERLWQEFLNFYLPSQLPVFALGILLYFIIKQDYKVSLSPVTVLICSIILVAHFAGIRVLPDHVLLSIGFVGMAIALSKFEFRAFVNPVFVYLGRVSYSMYLVHFAVLFWLNRFNAVDYISVSGPFEAIINYGMRLGVLTVITVLLSSVFYYSVELPLQRIGKKLITLLKSTSTLRPAIPLQNLSVLPPPVTSQTFTGSSPDTLAKIENEK
jgi:peptidoglycan/LPS O-acetylase OafA/YrhL